MTVEIAGKKIGDGRCYIVSEIGNNHNVNIETARKLIKASAECGADAVKFQTFRARDIVNPNVPADAYPGWDVSDKFDYWYQFVETHVMPWEWYDELIEYSRSLGLAFISTPASIEAAHFLADKKIDALKIASMDLNNTPFLREADTLGLPVILATGMSTIEEIEEAAALFQQSPLILLHCVSNYPLDHRDANLMNIKMLKDRFTVPVGFSNHALGHDLDIAAVVLGAGMIEKHFTLDRADTSVAEHHFSMEPQEMAELVRNVRMIEKALGSYERVLSPEEIGNRENLRRSIAARHDLKAGSVIGIDDLIVVRPGTGLAPGDMDRILGKKLKTDIKANDLISLSDIT